jgi:hypothetical protein
MKEQYENIEALFGRDIENFVEWIRAPRPAIVKHHAPAARIARQAALFSVSITDVMLTIDTQLNNELISS